MKSALLLNTDWLPVQATGSGKGIACLNAIGLFQQQLV